MASVELAQSTFVPVALGFFGLGTGYLIWGPQELFNFPPRDQSVDRSLGVWGIFLPGLCQVLTGLLLFVGLTWLQVFSEKPLYMAAVAFTAYGIHWFALGWNRYRGDDPRPNAGMSVAFTVLSILGAVIFYGAGAWPVGVLFTALIAIYVVDFFVALGSRPLAKVLGLLHCLTGLWLMWLTFATVLNIVTGTKLPA
jgi:hypothetical protein